MASRRSWVWVVAAISAAAVVAMIAVAAAGAYFMFKRVQARPSTGADAIKAFDEVIVAFPQRRPLLEAEVWDQVRVVRPLTELPTGRGKPTNLWMLKWEPDDQRLVRLSVPFWMLRLGRQKLHVKRGGEKLDLSRLDLDVDELERVGPRLVLDLRSEDGGRLLLWTE